MEMKKYVSPDVEIIKTSTIQFLCGSGFTEDDDPVTPGLLDDDDEP